MSIWSERRGLLSMLRLDSSAQPRDEIICHYAEMLEIAWVGPKPSTVLKFSTYSSKGQEVLLEFEMCAQC